ncbi:CMRF35-like molecule 3 [Cheilinus undulatus]|uniref:CMRF35-like molecule 3 n=1 Tax=Cheilinus undulatus TaxID=241271 RepID=UPI001BD5B2EA|nr:CMRF35-like molecule 3 [Cheilinus undulatus]
MRTSRISLGFFNAPALCLLWLTKHAEVSAQLSAPGVVTGVYGGSVNVSCQYDLKFREYTKYWCKGQVYEFCEIVVKTPRSRPNARSFIVDDKEAGVFTVTMTSLNKSDGGMYWCVIARKGKNNYAGVQLRLSKAVFFPTVITTTTITTPLPTHEENSSWVTLRWILFILMLCCVVATHIITWRIKTTRRAQPHQQLQNQNSNIYE